MSSSILYISYDGMTDPLGQSQVLPYLAGLAAKGYRISLLSCEKLQRFTAHRSGIESFCKKSDIDWHPIPYTASPPVLSTIKDLSALKARAAALHREHRFDVVHCRSYIAAITGLWMKRTFNTRFIFDMRGFWADERIDGGLWNRSNPMYSMIYRYFKKKEKQFLRESDAIISLTHAGKEEIDKWHIPGMPHITVIPCCVDTELFDPGAINREKRQVLKQQAGIPDNATVLGYVGSLGTWYLLPEMLSFFKVWLEEHPHSVLFFVTTEPPEMILTESEKQGIAAEYIRIASAGRAEMPYYISLMDYGLFFLKQAFSKKASSPVKQGELMAMGVPVICNAGVGDSDRIVQQYRAGVLVDQYNEDAYRKAIREALRTNFDPAAIRAGCVDYFDLEKGISAYEAVYESVL